MHRVVEVIVESNKWRNSEFAKFKVNAQAVEPVLWCRMCIPMVYAHWEGFVVSSLKILIEYLNTLKLDPNDVPIKLVVVGLADKYKPLSGKQSFEQRVEFTDNFKNIFGQVIKLKKKIDTKSNLRSDVLKELCQMFDLDFIKFDEFTSVIDRLVNVRNSIAHGENSIKVSQENINAYMDSVNGAMEVFLNEVNLYLENESYLAKQVA